MNARPASAHAVDRHGPGLFERVAIVGVMFLYTSAVIRLLVIGNHAGTYLASEEQRSILRNLWWIAYLATFALILSMPGRSRVWSALGASRLLLVLLGYTLLSCLWSIDPDASVRRWLALCGTTLFGVYLGVRLDVRTMLVLLAWALGLAMVASLLIAVLMPDLGVMQWPTASVGAWQGAFTHRNTLGPMALLNCLVVIVLLGVVRRGRGLLWADLALSIFLIIMTRSSTPLVLGPAALGLFWLVRIARAHPRLLTPGFLTVGVLVAVGVLTSINAILDLVGRDTTLSGRVDLWAVLWDMIESHWLLGYGYQAFWITENGPVQEVWQRVSWQPPSGHNGFLDLWLSLGFIGLVAFVVAMISPVLRAWLRIPVASREESDWLVSYLGLYLLLGLNESYYLEPNSLFWVLVVVAFLPMRASATTKPSDDWSTMLMPGEMRGMAGGQRRHG